MSVRVGCSGWNYAEWRGLFYPGNGCPTRRWLEYYAERFDTVEVNSTFYRLASPKAVARWLEQTPDDFVFAPKMSRYNTHVKRLSEMDVTVRRFYDAIKPLAESHKMGPVLWQLPGNFRRDDERLLFALSNLPPGRHCFEFRHESWFDENVYDLMRAHDAALVIGFGHNRLGQIHPRVGDTARQNKAPRRRPSTLQQHRKLVDLVKGDRRIQRLFGRGTKPA